MQFKPGPDTQEAYQTRAVIEKPSARALYNLMLYTGLRLAEVKQLTENPGIFDQERRTITIKSGKAKASQISRNVCLSDKGLLAVEEYLKTPSVPKSPSVMADQPYPVGTTRPYSRHYPGRSRAATQPGSRSARAGRRGRAGYSQPTRIR